MLNEGIMLHAYTYLLRINIFYNSAYIHYALGEYIKFKY